MGTNTPASLSKSAIVSTYQSVHRNGVANPAGCATPKCAWRRFARKNARTRAYLCARPRVPLWGRFSTCGRFPTGLPRASANAAKAGCKPAAGWKPAPQSTGESTSTSHPSCGNCYKTATRPVDPHDRQQRLTTPHAPPKATGRRRPAACRRPRASGAHVRERGRILRANCRQHGLVFI